MMLAFFKRSRNITIKFPTALLIWLIDWLIANFFIFFPDRNVILELKIVSN